MQVLKCGKTHAEHISGPSELHLGCSFARKSQVCWCGSRCDFILWLMSICVTVLFLLTHPHWSVEQKYN